MRIHRGRPTGWRVALAATVLPLAASAFALEGGALEPPVPTAAPEPPRAEPALALAPPAPAETPVQASPAEQQPPVAAAAAARRALAASRGRSTAAADESGESGESGESAPQDPSGPATPTELALVIGRMQAVEAPWPVAGVSLTDPTIADVEILTEVLLMVTGRGPGATDLLLWNDLGQTFTLPIEVQIDGAGLQADLNLLFPDSSLAIGQSRGVAVISGVLARAEQATQLAQFMEATGLPYVDATRVAGVQQVQVQVRMAEVSRTGLRALGVNAFSTSDNWFGGVSVGSSNGGALNPVQIGPGEGTPIDPLSVQFNEDVLLSPAVTLFAGSTNAGFQVFIQALQENQYLRILAEPNLVALSGEKASFLAGGEFPIPVVQGTTTGGGTAVTIEYKEFGVALKFRPVVLGDGSIRMTVASEVSELSDIGAVEIEGFRVPSVATRRAETTLEMKSGQTFAMAGLISESTSAISSQVPGLGSLPVLGALFRSVRYRRGESELLLLVTASLVEPTSDQVLLPLPGDDARRAQRLGALLPRPPRGRGARAPLPRRPHLARRVRARAPARTGCLERPRPGSRAGLLPAPGMGRARRRAERPLRPHARPEPELEPGAAARRGGEFEPASRSTRARATRSSS